MIETENTGRETEGQETTQRVHRRFRRGRHETCRGCGFDWNVSTLAVIPKSGYLCPICWGKYRNK